MSTGSTDNGVNLGALQSQYTVTPYTPTAGSYTNPYYTGGGVTQAGSNAQTNAALATAQGTAAAGLSGQANANAAETGLATNLQNIATGAAPSVAQAQLAQNTSTDVGAEMALAGQARGGNVATGSYNSAAGAGNVTEQAAGAAATAGIQERAADATNAGGLFGNVAASNLGTAQLGTQAAEYNTGANITQQQNELQASENQQSLIAQQQLAAQQINAGTSQSNAKTNASLFGSLESGVGSAVTMAAMAAKDGAIVPGPHTQKDDHPAMLSGGELVIPVHDPSYAAIRAHLAAVKSTPAPKPSRGAQIASRMR